MRSEIIRAARDWLGTPYVHQGRLKHVGVDCAGVVIGVAKELDLATITEEHQKQISRYNPVPKPAMMQRVLSQHLDPVAPGRQKPGDVAWMAWRNGRGTHVGILTDFCDKSVTLVHVDAFTRYVAERRIPSLGTPKVVAYYKFRGVDA